MSSEADLWLEFKAIKDQARIKITDRYETIGFISSGTYGRVYKAKSKEK
jgi:cyclin-dependent kinase 8/11